MNIGNMEIHYITETTEDYTEAIKGAVGKAQLIAAIKPFEPFARDAMEQALNIESWDEYERYCLIAREEGFVGEGAGDLVALTNKYGAILIPEVMLRVTMIAGILGVPWGCAAIRMAEEGMLIEEDGYAVIKERASVSS